MINVIVLYEVIIMNATVFTQYECTSFPGKGRRTVQSRLVAPWWHDQQGIDLLL